MLKEQNSTRVGLVSVRYSQDITESARRGVVELIANFEPILPGPCTELSSPWRITVSGNGDS